MQKQAYIFTECGSQIGYGHLTRCIALYDELVALGVETKFVLNADDNSIAQVLEERNFVLDNWYDDPWKAVGTNVSNEIYAIVDSYIAETETYVKISTRVKHKNGIAQAIYMDDTNRLAYPSGIIVNPSFFGEDLNYNRREDQIYLLGAQYIILRKAFYDLPNTTIRKEDNLKNILIVMGGADVKNVTPKIMKALNDSTGFEDCMKHVVMGKGFDNIDEIKNQETKFTKLYDSLNAKEMRDLMLTCDVAISAAGQTVHELLATQLPFVCIKVVDNQAYNVKGLLEHGIIEKYFDFESKTDMQISKELEKLPEMLKSLYTDNKTKDAVLIEHGARNIVHELINESDSNNL